MRLYQLDCSDCQTYRLVFLPHGLGLGLISPPIPPLIIQGALISLPGFRGTMSRSTEVESQSRQTLNEGFALLDSMASSAGDKTDADLDAQIAVPWICSKSEPKGAHKALKGLDPKPYKMISI